MSTTTGETAATSTQLLIFIQRLWFGVPAQLVPNHNDVSERETETDQHCKSLKLGKIEYRIPIHFGVHVYLYTLIGRKIGCQYRIHWINPKKCQPNPKAVCQAPDAKYGREELGAPLGLLGLRVGDNKTHGKTVTRAITTTYLTVVSNSQSMHQFASKSWRGLHAKSQQQLLKFQSLKRRNFKQPFTVPFNRSSLWLHRVTSDWHVINAKWSRWCIIGPKSLLEETVQLGIWKGNHDIFWFVRVASVQSIQY